MPDAGATFDRHYSVPGATRWFLRCFVAAAALIGLGSLLDNQSGLSAPVIAVPYYAVLALIVVWSERGLRRAGMYESADGIRVVRLGGLSTFAGSW